MKPFLVRGISRRHRTFDPEIPWERETIASFTTEAVAEQWLTTNRHSLDVAYFDLQVEDWTGEVS